MNPEEQTILLGAIMFFLILAFVVLSLIWVVQKLSNRLKKTSSHETLTSLTQAGEIEKETPLTVDPSRIYPEPKEHSAMNIEAKGKYVFTKELGNLRPVHALSMDYHYKRKDLIMTQAETRFFKILTEAIGDEYYIFPQVHLSSILEHRIHGQNWWAAFHHINRKSVDFVICDKESVRPLAAIELDDWSHRLDHRKDRDAEVERIFEGAELPLIRFNGNTRFTYSFVRETISQSGAIPILTP